MSQIVSWLGFADVIFGRDKPQSEIRLRSQARLYVPVNLLAGLWPPYCMTPLPSCVMRPRAVPLAMIAMRKSIHGFPFLSNMSIGLCF